MCVSHRLSKLSETLIFGDSDLERMRLRFVYTGNCSFIPLETDCFGFVDKKALNSQELIFLKGRHLEDSGYKGFYIRFFSSYFKSPGSSVG